MATWKYSKSRPGFRPLQSQGSRGMPGKSHFSPFQLLLVHLTLSQSLRTYTKNLYFWTSSILLSNRLASGVQLLVFLRIILCFFLSFVRHPSFFAVWGRATVGETFRLRPDVRTKWAANPSSWGHHPSPSTLFVVLLPWSCPAHPVSRLRARCSLNLNFYTELFTFTHTHTHAHVEHSDE